LLWNRGKPIGEYFIDILVEDAVILELKSVERHDPVFEAQILSYMKLTGKKVGLLINFNSKMVKDGIRRFVL
jgi:GxxExxY protein